MGRGVAVVYPEKSFRGQLKRAHRLLKNAQIDTWATGAALFAHMTQAQRQVGIAVDWTALGAFRVLEACLIVEGRGMPFYSIVVHKEELKHRQTLVELTMWYALIAMRQAGQTLLVAVDRGFAKFAWVGESPLYPFMHLLLRLKRTTLLTWGTIQGPLHAWPLSPGAVVEIDEAAWGARRSGGDGRVSGASPRRSGAPGCGLSHRRQPPCRGCVQPASGRRTAES